MNDQLFNEVSDFLKEKNSKYLACDDKTLRQLLEFYDTRGAMGICRDGGAIVGVGMARPVRVIRLFNEREHGAMVWDFDERDGDTLYIQDIAASHKSIIPLLWSMMVERFGVRKYVGGMRHDRIRFWNFEKYENRLNHMNLLKG